MRDENESAEREDLRERTKRFAIRIVRMFTALPKTAVAQVLGKQALRSGTSVGANFREAFRARSNAEFAAKLGDCLKELDETSYWMELLSDTKVLQPERLSDLHDECSQLIAILTSIVKKIRRA
jgi:four helix bundle protein